MEHAPTLEFRYTIPQNPLHSADLELLEVVKRAYAGFDESHGVGHAQRVHDNAILILSRVVPALSWITQDMVRWIAALHDACDHKYPDAGLGKTVLKLIFAGKFGTVNAELCMYVLDHISWSKRHIPSELSGASGWELLRQIVQDADWLEAIGNTGITRCEIYSRAHSATLPNMTGDDVESLVKARIIEHVHEKLIHVASNLNTEVAREMAIPLHQQLLEYLALNKASSL